MDQLLEIQKAIPLVVCHVSWNEAIYRYKGYDEFTEIPIDKSQDNQFLLGIKTKDKHHLIISDVNHRLPVLDSKGTHKIYTKIGSKIREKGFMIDMFGDENYGILVWIPYLPGDKIYGYYYQKSQTHPKQVIDVGKIKTHNPIPECKNIKSPRDIDSKLNEIDRIRIETSLSSKRFDYGETLFSSLKSVDTLLTSVKDPAYITKLLNLNYMLNCHNADIKNM